MSGPPASDSPATDAATSDSPATDSPATDNATTDSATRGAAGGAGCEALTAATVSAAAGFAVSPAVAGGAAPVFLCTYKATNGTGLVLIRKQTGVEDAIFQGDRAAMNGTGEPTTDLPGIGDKAYSSVIGKGDFTTSTVVTLHGKNEILVSINGPKTDVHVAGAVALAALQAFGF